jgi:hypothetical protein
MMIDRKRFMSERLAVKNSFNIISIIASDDLSHIDMLKPLPCTLFLSILKCFPRLRAFNLVLIKLDLATLIRPYDDLISALFGSLLSAIRDVFVLNFFEFSPSS